MKEDISLNLELGGCFMKRKREKFPEEEMIDIRGRDKKKTERKKNMDVPLFMHLSLPSALSENKNKKIESFQDRFAHSIEEEYTKATPAVSAGSHHSMASSIEDKIREKQAKEDENEVAIISDTALNNEENNHARKKLMLSKEKAMLLEEHFRDHATLNPKLKLDLAKKLSLQPRQVEVWFQNRRARTKLKQTETNCKYLNDWYRMLSQENCRLKRELTELRALKLAYAPHPFYQHLAATGNLSSCPSCEHRSKLLSGALMEAPSDHKPASFAELLSKPRFFTFIPERRSPSII